MNFLNEFVLLLKARYPIIYIATNEEERIEYLIRYCAKKYVVRTYYSWDFVDGYQGNPNDTGFAARNPLEALDLIDKFYQKFQNGDQVVFSHPVSMLLTLSVWCEKFWKRK